MRKTISPILSATILGGALLLCPPSHATPFSAHANDEPVAFQAPMRYTCANIFNYIRGC